MGAPLTVGYGDGRKLPRLGRACGRARGPSASPISTKATGRWSAATGSRFSTATTSRSSARSSNPERRRRRSRRAITRHYMQKEIFEQPIVVAADSPELCPPVRGRGRAAGRGGRPRSGRPADDRRLRHQLLRRAGRQILGRAIRSRAGRHRCRERVPLPRAGARAGRAGAVHQPVGRDRRHARRAAPCARRAAADRGGRQRPDQLDGARGRPAAADPCRAGDRRRLDQGVHLPARGARRACRQPGAGQGPAHPRRGEGDRRPSPGSAGSDQRGARPRRRHRGDGAPRSRRRATCSISAAVPIIRWRSKVR